MASRMAQPGAKVRVNARRRETYDAEQRRAYREANIERIRLVERRCHLMREYGMTLEEYDEMVVEQEGRCAICKQLAELLFVDHCHASGKRRKGLCESCNWGLGNFADDPVRLRAAADYVEEFQRIKDVHTA
jgi:DNA-binding transcriptional MerR regulator